MTVRSDTMLQGMIPHHMGMHLAALLVLALPVPAAAQDHVSPCELAAAEVAWMQQALDAWEHVAWNLLASDPHPLPWIVLFNAECTFHLAPARPPAGTTRIDIPLSFAGVPTQVLAVAHRGTIGLPNGRRVPPQPVATTSLYDRNRSAFFVMALPAIWRRLPRYAQDPTVEAWLLGVLSHEMAHTRQIVSFNRRLQLLRKRAPLPDGLNDDIVEQKFRGVPGFKEAFDAERTRLFDALAERDLARQRSLTAEAVALIRDRRARFFTGPLAVYAELEDLFLVMEGLGEWCNFKLRIATLGEDEAAAIKTARDNVRNAWTQAEGLALFLLLDRLVPAWQQRVLSEEATSPVDLLARAGLREPGN